MSQRAVPSAFIAVTPVTRKLIANVVEDLLLLLDEIDGDPDLEPDADGEPILGWREERRGDEVCPTPEDEAETAPWPEHPSQHHIGRLARHDENEEEAALERHGTGFIASGSDDAEDSDPGGGDILDEPHDPDDGYGAIADPDALHLVRDEFAFQRWMDDSRRTRFAAHEATRAQIMKMTGRRPDSHWGLTARVQPW